MVFDQVPLQSIYALPATARMDAPLMREVMTRGHSRVPVYWGKDASSMTSFILVKDQLMLNPTDGAI